MLYGTLDERGVWGRINTCICMAESLCCPPETLTALLLGILQYKKKFKEKNPWTLWEKARVGCFKRIALKHVYYLG